MIGGYHALRRGLHGLVAGQQPELGFFLFCTWLEVTCPSAVKLSLVWSMWITSAVVEPLGSQTRAADSSVMRPVLCSSMACFAAALRSPSP